MANMENQRTLAKGLEHLFQIIKLTRSILQTLSPFHLKLFVNSKKRELEEEESKKR